MNFFYRIDCTTQSKEQKNSSSEAAKTKKIKTNEIIPRKG